LRLIVQRSTRSAPQDRLTILQPCSARFTSVTSSAPSCGGFGQGLVKVLPRRGWCMKFGKIMSACSVSTGILRFGILRCSRNFLEVVSSPRLYSFFLVLVSLSRYHLCPCICKWDDTCHGRRVKHAAEA
jgi:hypothetical protein